ncbi:hypothetical protein GOP47_0010319 [Adiantum capillus-veneris]|uniref:Uncharacterized protein n=1 Tax=Adiantum capillus-veneris TaxID=13818 RepID=A0A9D4UVN0_ADICA|nr:hypothetical protein GOP47_0010319 [Adiantum capillus-veneris]
MIWQQSLKAFTFVVFGVPGWFLSSLFFELLDPKSWVKAIDRGPSNMCFGEAIYKSVYEWTPLNSSCSIQDSLVTNPTIALDDIINSIVGSTNFHHMPDFIVTEDVTGINAGMFFFRNSSWSIQFLDLWWKQTSFVRPFGQRKSGDNDALKFLIKTMRTEERRQHVRIPEMQCVFNSNPWLPSWKSGHRLMTLTKTVWQGVYSKGDFMVHLAGLNDKKKWIKKILQDIKEEERMTQRRLHREKGQHH